LKLPSGRGRLMNMLMTANLSSLYAMLKTVLRLKEQINQISNWVAL